MDKKLVVINVLAKESYDDCHIKNSINVPINELEAYAKDLAKDTPVIVYCASYQCNASRDAYKQLKKMGFQTVWAYEGGMAEWLQKGYPCQGPCNKDYLKQVYEKPAEPSEVNEISAEELKNKIEQG